MLRKETIAVFLDVLCPLHLPEGGSQLPTETKTSLREECVYTRRLSTGSVKPNDRRDVFENATEMRWAAICHAWIEKNDCYVETIILAIFESPTRLQLAWARDAKH